jgi:FixJ family two-component response regulator
MDKDSRQLSEREKEAIQFLLQGKRNRQTASELGIANRTVEFHYKQHQVPRGTRQDFIKVPGFLLSRSRTDQLGSEVYFE